MIALEQLSKRYGTFDAVRSLTFEVAPGELFAFLGPNGAGKTTTIRMLTGILVPTGGSAQIAGHDCHRDRPAVMRHVGYLPDGPIFYDYLRGEEILQFVGEMHGLGRAAARRRAGQLLEELGLDEAAREFAINYSMGMKKRLGLACALVHEPPVLILDEPTNGLDPRASRDVQDRLRAAVAGGTTVLLSTHLLDMAERLATRIGIIHQGQLAALGPTAEVKAHVAAGGSLEEVFLKLTEDAPA